MKNLLKLEELAQFALCLVLLAMNTAPWWAYVLIAIGPDISMLGYLVNAKVGAVSYNLFHHKGIALMIALVAVVSEGTNLLLATPMIGHALLMTAIVLFGHSSMDRMFGYGLKYGDDFKHTHLGVIGKKGQ